MNKKEHWQICDCDIDPSIKTCNLNTADAKIYSYNQETKRCEQYPFYQDNERALWKRYENIAKELKEKGSVEWDYEQTNYADRNVYAPDLNPTKAKRYNKDKLMWECLPLESLIEIARVATMGADKYGRGNWKKGQPLSDLADATLRHLIGDKNHLGAFTGELKDPESGIYHAAHAVWNLLAIIHQLRNSDKYKQFNDLGE